MSDDAAAKPALVGVPFQKGKSGNPKGRTRGLATRIRQATKDGKDIVATARELLDKGPPNVRMEAVKWFADRYWGKSAETVLNVNADASGGVLGQLSVSDLKALFLHTQTQIELARRSTITPSLAAESASVSVVDAPKHADSDAPSEEDT